VTTAGGALARFCAELPRLRAVLRGDSERTALLTRIERAARAGEPIADLLRQLGIAVADDGEPSHPRGSGWSSLTRSGGHTVSGGLVCPLELCGRYERREPSGPLPTCHLNGTPLRFQPDE
jgi:hypothetical protein